MSGVGGMVLMPFSDLSIAAAQILGGSLSVSFFLRGCWSISASSRLPSMRTHGAVGFLPFGLCFLISSALGTSLQVVITWFSAFDDVCGPTSLHL